MEHQISTSMTATSYAASIQMEVVIPTMSNTISSTAAGYNW
jgi:hypothetical protein